MQSFQPCINALSAASTQWQDRFNRLQGAEVVEWQTRTFEGRVAQAVRVQVPPSAPNLAIEARSFGESHVIAGIHVRIPLHATGTRFRPLLSGGASR